MRSIRMAPWAICALLMATAGTLSADKKVSVNECVDYSQDDTDDGLSIRLASSCQVDLRCEVRWSLTCEGDKPKKDVSAFALIADTSHKVNVSAASCGELGWQIDRVAWSCRPE
jgi:hypothetical protein